MTAADRHAPDAHADERETLAELIGDRLRLIHFDGTGCGTHGSNACSNCHGPSPMDSYEIGCDLADTLRAAGVRGPEAVAQIEGERDAALAVIGADDRLDNWNRLLDRAERAEARLAAVEAERDALLAKYARATNTPMSRLVGPPARPKETP